MGRLLSRYAVTVLAVLAVLAVVLDRGLHRAFLDELTDSLAAQARAVRAALPADDAALQRATVALGRDLEVRITVVGPDGRVVADSAGDPGTLPAPTGRPEVRAALQGRIGADTRPDEAAGEAVRYVAIPPEDGRIVRVALPVAVVEERLGALRALLAAGIAAAAILGLAAVVVLARGLTRPLQQVTESVAGMGTGNLDVRVDPSGPAEVALLADTINRMSERLRESMAATREATETRDLVLSALEDGVMLIEPDGGVAYANPAAATLLGAPPRSARELSFGIRRAVEAAAAGDPVEDELETAVPRRVLRAAAAPVGGGRVLLVLRDVTQTRRVEAMRRDFVENASHELKTPVASMQAAAETLVRAVREDPRAARRFAERLLQDAVRLSRVVSDLLDLSRLETERLALEPVRLDLLAREEADRVAGSAREAGIELDVEAEEVVVRGSSRDLSLLLRNLLDNAVRHTPAGGRVRVGVGRSDAEAVVTVADTGIGIPSRDLPRIFERFYRVDRARSRETGGTGLGLSIARHVVEQHGGRIEVESELGAGSTFRVRLPAGEPPP